MPELKIPRRGLMLVLSSPSGAGKTTIARALLGRDSGIAMSVSCTTRPKRPEEKEGRDYHFIDETAFDRQAREGAFLEHAKIFGNRYGTPKVAVENALKAGRDLLFDIDWQGNRALKKLVGDDLVSVFILPPSMETLDHRLRARAQDAEDVVRKRMARAEDEISHWDEFDYLIVNENLEESVEAVHAILKAERLRRTRQTDLPDFVCRSRKS
ncbi:MAG: guanylate kinase [Pseudomonadota bacterium]